MKLIQGGEAPLRRQQHEAAIRGAGFIGPNLSDRFVIIEWDNGARASLILAPEGRPSIEFALHMRDATDHGDDQKWARCFCRIITVDGEIKAIGHETREGAWFFLDDIEGVSNVKIR